MNLDERKNQLLDIWHGIATDRSLQVGLRLRASEYEAKALGLIGDTPGITIVNEPDNVNEQLKRLTMDQLEQIAAATDAEIVGALKTASPEALSGQPKTKKANTSTTKKKTHVVASVEPTKKMAKKGA